MYFKLSNTAEKDILERMTKASFKYPNLYKPQSIIHGLKEESIPIITMEKPDELSLSIWGLLPENYAADWSDFQNNFNTLNFPEDLMDCGLWYAEALKNKRCLIPITGFFTTFIENGEIYNFKISLKDGGPFYLAGIYTILEDGFITCSILTGKSDDFIKRVQNTVDAMPLTIPIDKKDEWLDFNTTPMRTRQFLKKPPKQDFSATSISDIYYNQKNLDKGLDMSFG